MTVVLIQRVAVVGGRGTVWITVVTLCVSLPAACASDVDDSETAVPERVEDLVCVLVMVLSTTVTLREAEAEGPTVSVETITVTI